MNDTHPIRVLLLGVACLATLLLAGNLTACGAGETSTCEVGGDCETQQLSQCTCCPGDQVSPCQTNISDACATGELTVSGSAATCAEFNGNWTAFMDAGDDPCLEFTDDELTDFCDQAVSMFE